MSRSPASTPLSTTVALILTVAHPFVYAHCCPLHGHWYPRKSSHANTGEAVLVPDQAISPGTTTTRARTLLDSDGTMRIDAAISCAPHGLLREILPGILRLDHITLGSPFRLLSLWVSLCLSSFWHDAGLSLCLTSCWRVAAAVVHAFPQMVAGDPVQPWQLLVTPRSSWACSRRGFSLAATLSHHCFCSRLVSFFATILGNIHSARDTR